MRKDSKELRRELMLNNFDGIKFEWGKIALEFGKLTGEKITQKQARNRMAKQGESVLKELDGRTLTPVVKPYGAYNELPCKRCTYGINSICKVENCRLWFDYIKRDKEERESLSKYIERRNNERKY